MLSCGCHVPSNLHFPALPPLDFASSALSPTLLLAMLFSSSSGQIVWIPVFISHPTSSLLWYSVGSTFKIYLEFHHYLPLPTAITLVKGTINFHVDHSGSIASLPAFTLVSLFLVTNSTAKQNLLKHKSRCYSSLLKTLKWLPISFRIKAHIRAIA